MNLSLFSSSNCVVKHIICSTLATTHNRAQPIPYMYSKSPTDWEAWVFSFLPYTYSKSPTNWEAPTSCQYIAIHVSCNTIYCNTRLCQYNILVLLQQPIQFIVNNILQYIVLFYPGFHSPRLVCTYCSRKLLNNLLYNILILSDR